MRTQGSLEYLVVIAVILAISAAVIMYVTNLVGTQNTSISVSSCKQAAIKCSLSRINSPTDPCTLCKTACNDPNGNELFNGAVYCCANGQQDMIYSGSLGCGGGYTPPCNGEECIGRKCKSDLDCNTIPTYSDWICSRLSIDGKTCVKEQRSATQYFCNDWQCTKFSMFYNKTNPKGIIRVLVFEVKPFDFYDRNETICCYGSQCSSVEYSMYNPLYCKNYSVTELFNRQDPTDSIPSVYSIKKWYETEASVYGADLTIDLSFAGPFTVDRFNYGFQTPPDLDNFLNFFDVELADKGYDKNNYEIIHFVYFDDFSINADTTISGFRSFALRETGETFNDVLSGFPAIETIIHEMGHIFNADDLYSGYLCKVPEGIPEPEQTIQTKACLMCQHILTGKDSSREPNSLDEIILCDYTATQFGWLGG